MDSSSWEEASMEVLSANKKQRDSVRDNKILIILQLIEILKALSLEYEVEIVKKDCNIFEYKKKLDETTSNKENLTKIKFIDIKVKNAEELRNSLLTVNIKKFIQYNSNKIKCRIFFILNKEIETFIECNLIEENEGVDYRGHILSVNIDGNVKDQKVIGELAEGVKFKGNIFSVDFNRNIKDQTGVFSKKCTYHNFFLKVLEVLKGKITKSGKDCWDFIDNKRIKKLPKSIALLKFHQLYTVESLLRKNEIIFPKRQFKGLIAGQKVYEKKNICKLRTEKSWYKLGMKLKKDVIKPYRVVNHKNESLSLYSPFQVEEVVVFEISKFFMDSFHSNFTPQNSVKIFLKEMITFVVERLLGNSLKLKSFSQNLLMNLAEDPTEFDVKNRKNLIYSSIWLHFNALEIAFAFTVGRIDFIRKSKVIDGIFVEKDQMEVSKKLIYEIIKNQVIKSYNEKFEELVKNFKNFIRKVKLHLKIKKKLNIE